MAIQILMPPEPNPIAPQESDAVVIESAGLRQLDRELERYCRREIDGRSFLISGHRGAGKTTMVNYALWHAIREAGFDQKRARPLVIRLHGPNLIRRIDAEHAEAPAPPATDKAAAGGSDNSTDKNIAQVEYLMARQRELDRETGELRRVQIALQQITLGLHRALATEITASYRRRVKEVATPATQRELYERAAQLEMELDQYPTPDRLRQYWAAGNFLYDGVLFTPTPERRMEVPDQGLRELVALASVCHAFLRVSGKFEKAELKQSLSSAQSSSLTVGGKEGYDVLAPLLAILGGGAVGTASATLGGQPAITSTLAGLLAAFGAAGVFKYSSSRTRSRGFSSDLTFMPDLRVSTLDRVLPMLIDRIRSAGLVPVFVVDELDKIDNLSEQLDGIVRHMKNIVAERAFFCFLTDRSYYERVVKVNVLDPYPKDYTYFSDRVFVSFQSGDLLRYLNNILKVGAGIAETIADPSAPEPSSSAQDEDRLDLEVLPYVLLRRSQLHALDLRRELSVWRDKSNPQVIDSRRVRALFGYRFDLLVQFAVELIVNRTAVAERLRQDPTLSRLLYDALYYPIRMLGRKPKEEDGPDAFARVYTIDLSDAAMAQKNFRDYLVERMSSDKEDPKSKGYVPLGLEGVDIDFLYEQVRALVALLADPFALMDELSSAENRIVKPATTLLQSLPLNPPDGPLVLRKWPAQHTYEWRYRADWSPRREADPFYSNTRHALAHQLDLYVNLAVRMVMLTPEAKGFIRNSAQRRDLLENVLRLPHDMWLRGSTSILLHGHIFTANLVSFLPDINDQQAARELLARLANLLSSHDEYFAWLYQHDLRDRYDIIRKTFQRHAPLIKKGNGEELVFQYDRDGNPLVDGLENQFWADIDSDWERNLMFVQDLSAFLRSWAARTRKDSPSALDFSTLTATVRILPVTPSWPVVEAAVSRLERYRSDRQYYPQIDEDGKLIASYIREVLLPTRHALANALIVGSIIGRASGSDFGPGCVKGLGILQHAYRFGQAEGDNVDETLDRLAHSLAPCVPGMAEQLEELRRANSGDLKSWMEALDKLAASIQNVAFGTQERAAFIERAWKTWRTFLLSNEAAAARFVASADNLLCRAGAFGPDAFLSETPSAMSLAQWSDAYLRSALGEKLPAEDRAPDWLAGVARSALHLDPGDATISKRALIVRGDSQLSTQWSVPQGYGVLSLTSRDVDRLLSLLAVEADILPGMPKFDHVFVEHDANMNRVPDLLARMAQRADRVKPAALVFGGGPNQSAPAWALRVVDRATGPDELMRVLESRTVEDESQLPGPLLLAWSSGAVMTGALFEELPAGDADARTIEARFEPRAPGRVRVRSQLFPVEVLLSFARGELVRRSPLSHRRYRVTFDGATLCIEQRGARAGELLDLWRLLAELLYPLEKIELTQRAHSSEFDVRMRTSYGPLARWLGKRGEQKYYGVVTIRSARQVAMPEAIMA